MADQQSVWQSKIFFASAAIAYFGAFPPIASNPAFIANFPTGLGWQRLTGTEPGFPFAHSFIFYTDNLGFSTDIRNPGEMRGYYFASFPALVTNFVLLCVALLVLVGLVEWFFRTFVKEKYDRRIVREAKNSQRTNM